MILVSRWNRTVETPKSYSQVPSGRQVLLDKIYIGKVKDNRDVRSMGRLKVWVPEISKEEDDPGGWVLVSYCSPFAGATSVRSEENRETGNQNTFDQTQKSYGWWAVPPDLNVQVLCLFVNGDPAKGYWIGCVYDEQMNFMVPGIASDDGQTPKAEYNRKVAGTGRTQNPPRPSYEPLDSSLKEQGLNSDTIRGLSLSSAKRKGDFGSSRDKNDRLTHIDKPAKNYGFLSPGGHQFVIDDGYQVNGRTENSLIRFRTRNGTQVLINDTEGYIYMITKNGNAWIELNDNNGAGNIDLYSTTNVSIHSESGNVNLKAGRNVNIQAGNSINMKSGSDSFLHSESNIHFFAENELFNTGLNLHLNSLGTTFMTSVGNVQGSAAGFFIQSPAVSFNTAVVANALPAEKPKGISVPGPSVKSGDIWSTGSNYSSDENIIARVPQHEPWVLHTTTGSAKFKVTADTLSAIQPIQVSTTTTSNETLRTSDTAQVQNVSSKDVPAPSDPFVGDTPLGGTVCSLNEAETKSLLDYLGQRESSSNYQAVNTLNYLGKYQFGTAALEDVGYIKSGTFKDSREGKRLTGTQTALNDSSNWAGRDGINSKDDFLNSEKAQEKAIKKLMNRNCRSLKNLGVINDNTSSEDVAGYLAASHLGGTGAAKKLKEGKVAVDVYGGSTYEYYALGVTAVKAVSIA